ncbi:DUF2911 domain-containing protein [Maribacter chungangensis]|uniref:DUF2911 domain-containing protein n=1 Tax=Maribacter chungangensis TaxID=1069117 RepID=A0ABW3B3Z2_9FLAO
MKRFFCIVFLCAASTSWAQLEHPKASPFASIEQKVGLSKISIEYSRPSAKGRHIFGTDNLGLPGVVPYGRIWRVGANESTKITFDTDVIVNRSRLLKGTYALYAFPAATEWEIVFHANTAHWGDGRERYDPSEDVLRVTVTPEKVLSYQENFMISFDAITHDSAEMVLQWANTRITVPVAFNTPELMEARIRQKLQDSTTAQTYYEIARYYQEQGVKTAIALDYVNKALDLGGETYYFYRVKSELQAALGLYRQAVLSATTSQKISQSLGKDEFVRLNQRNIRNWKKLYGANTD